MVRISSSLLVLSLSEMVKAGQEVGTESAGMLQFQNRGTQRAAAAGGSQTRLLFDTAQRLLREGATPAVTEFTAEMTKKLQDDVLPSIKAGHTSDMELMDAAYADLQTVVSENAARMQSVQAKRQAEATVSAEHQECRKEEEKPKCEVWQECEAELATLKAQYEKEEKDFRDLVKMNECPASGHEESPTLVQMGHAERVLKAEQKRDLAKRRAEAGAHHSAAASAHEHSACPWLDGSSGVQDNMVCMDGSMCDVEEDSSGWQCCDSRGGRGKCPPAFPHLCADNSCATECTSTAGGLKVCTEGSACRDVADWVDTDGDGCEAYHSCAGGRPLWALQTYEPYKNMGHTAVTACCVCGGGEDVHTEREDLIRVPQCEGEAAEVNAVIDAQRLVYKRVVQEGKERFEAWFKMHAKEAECKLKNDALSLQRAACDEHKIELELASCMSHSLHAEAVRTFETSWDEELRNFRQVCETVEQNAKDRRAELQALTEVNCLMKAIHDRSGLACEDDAEATAIITGCRSLTVQDEELQLGIECPEEPAKPDVLPEQPRSCEAAFEAQEYGNLWAMEGGCFRKTTMRECESCSDDTHTDS